MALRIFNEKILKEYRNYPCTCRSLHCIGDVVAHHIYSRGSGGHDIDENLLPLCVKHHSEIHNIGLNSFVAKYSLNFIMRIKGWEFCETKGWQNYIIKRLKAD